jgi:hypothetical protein
MTTKTYNKLMFHFLFFGFLTNEMLGDLLRSPKSTPNMIKTYKIIPPKHIQMGNKSLLQINFKHTSLMMMMIHSFN